jgi:hypothetical protein
MEIEKKNKETVDKKRKKEIKVLSEDKNEVEEDEGGVKDDEEEVDEDEDEEKNEKEESDGKSEDIKARKSKKSPNKVCFYRKLN